MANGGVAGSGSPRYARPISAETDTQVRIPGYSRSSCVSRGLVPLSGARRHLRSHPWCTADCVGRDGSACVLMYDLRRASSVGVSKTAPQTHSISRGSSPIAHVRLQVGQSSYHDMPAVIVWSKGYARMRMTCCRATVVGYGATLTAGDPGFAWVGTVHAASRGSGTVPALPSQVATCPAWASPGSRCAALLPSSDAVALQ